MMGKNNNANSWLNAVKRVFSSPSNNQEKSRNKTREQNEPPQEEKKRGKRRWIFGKHLSQETTIQHKVAKTADSPAVSLHTVTTSGQKNLKLKQPNLETPLSDQQKHAIEMAMATTAAAEAAVLKAQAAVEIIRLSKPNSLLVKQHKAAVFIQTIFRGYLARRALLALKGVVKMQALIRGHNVRKRAKMTLQCIQSLVRVQALVCDQRRRLSCDATLFSQPNSSTKSICRDVSNSLDNLELEDIKALIQKAKECSLRQGKTFAHMLSHQKWTMDEDQISDSYEELGGRKIIHPTVRKDGNLCNQRDHPIKTVEIDTFRPYSFTSHNSFKSQNQHHQDTHSIPSSVYSPKTPSSSKTNYYQSSETPTSRAIYLHRLSLSENSCPLPRPSYMAATQSAIARVRSNSTPRLRPLSPVSRQQTSLAKKRLSFPILDCHNNANDDHEVNVRRYKVNCASQIGDDERLSVPYYLTE